FFSLNILSALPARAGMVPSYGPFPHLVGGAPRASGDGPNDQNPPRGGVTVLPARAGMVPRPTFTGVSSGRAPRASGDGPCSPPLRNAYGSCSPRERGWSEPVGRRADDRGVLPARAGMVPTSPPGRT